MKALQMARHYLLLATILPLAVPLPGAAQELDLAPKILYELKDDAAFNKGFGSGVWTLQDVNGDTYDDLLVTDALLGGAHLFRGAFYSGFDGRLLHQLDYHPIFDGIGGFAVRATQFAQLSDLDGDGIADFIAGITGSFDNKSNAFIVSAKSGSIIRAHQRSRWIHSTSAYALGDLDQDGFIDYGVGEEEDITIYSGSSGEQLARMNGREGLRLLEIDDLNEDGNPDLAVVEHGTNVIEFISGTLRGTFRTDSIPDNLILGRYFHDENDGNIFAAPSTNYTVQKVSDLDGDGFHEILVRRRNENGGHVRALIAISPKKAEKIWTVEAGATLTPWDIYGSIGEIGDLNGDGVTEIVTMTNIRHEEATHGEEGTLLVVISGLDGGILYTQALFPYWRSSLTLMSDLDGDGIREVAVGDTSWNDDAGKVIIYSFGPASQDLAPYRPGNPQLTVHATPEEVTIAWPAAITDPQPQWSTDLQTWKPVFNDTAPESGRFVLPGTEAEPQRYFRLQYEE